jgi:lysophospholipase L1-like esterase
MRICFIGDSFVNGTGDDDALGWVGRLVAKARHEKRDVTGYNLGIRGNTSADIAARWKNEAEVRSPTGLVFSFGANDCRAGRRIDPSASLANLETILTNAQRWLPTLMIGPGIIADDREANARIVALSADYAKACERIGVPYFEICNLLLESDTWTREALAGDGAHPNRLGYAMVADAIWSWRGFRDWLGEP